MKTSLKVLALAMLALLAVSAAFNAYACGSTKACKCESFAETHDIDKIPIKDLHFAFCDPRNCTDNGTTCCIKTFKNLFVDGRINKTVSPNPVFSRENVTINITVDVPANTTGIVQDFLPFGFTFVDGSLKIDGVSERPIIIDGFIEIRGLSPGVHFITFKATAPFTKFTFETFDVARAFFIRDGFILAFSQDVVFVTVKPLPTASVSVCPSPTKTCTG